MRSTTVDSGQVRTLLRDLIEADEAGDGDRFGRILDRIAALGAGVQGVLAAILLEESDGKLLIAAARALERVATEALAPFVLGLATSEHSPVIREIAVHILTRFRYPGAADALELLLLGQTTEHLLRSAIASYFVALGDSGVSTLHKAVLNPELGDFHSEVAAALASIGTEKAARSLFDLWKAAQDHQALMGGYYLLKHLAKMDASLLRGIVQDVLLSEANPSRKNIFLSSLAHADPALAMETAKGILAQESVVQVRMQAIMILGALKTRDSQEELLKIIRMGDRQDLSEAMNALLAQDRLLVDFSTVASLHAQATDPMVRAVLANLLAKNPEHFHNNAELTQSLVAEAKSHLSTNDPVLRAQSGNVLAGLSSFTSDPPGFLLDVHRSLTSEERDHAPMVMEQLSRYVKDPRVDTVLKNTLLNEQAGVPERILAAQAYIEEGRYETVYATISQTANPEMTSILSGLVMTKGGDESAKRLMEMAETAKDEAKREALLEQVKMWTEPQNEP